MNVSRRLTIIKQLLLIVFIVTSMTACAQSKKDISSLQLNENAEQFLSGTSGMVKGEMFDRPDMISYGVGNKEFTYKEYLPAHIEFLSYKGQLAGYAFKVYTLPDQEKIVRYLKDKYKGITEVNSKNEIYYSYKDKTLLVEFQGITQEQFKRGMNAYLSVKRIDFYEDYEAYEKKLSRH